MASMCAVSFERYGRLYYVDPGQCRPVVGDRVLVPTEDGPEVAECVWPARDVAAVAGKLPVLVGLATEADLRRDRDNRRRRAEAIVATRRLVREHGLPMKVAAVDYLDADRRFTVYFTAPERVDFRALVRDLARALGARIDLRQLGARDEARVQGGIGSCGRNLCCSTLLADFEPVAVRMAKDQDLPLNPLRISGACGRLLCCLAYEHPLYREFRATTPAPGTAVTSPAGPATVVGANVPTDTVVVKVTGSGARSSCPRAEVCAVAGRVRRRSGPVAPVSG